MVIKYYKGRKYCQVARSFQKCSKVNYWFMDNAQQHMETQAFGWHLISLTKIKRIMTFIIVLGQFRRKNRECWLQLKDYHLIEMNAKALSLPCCTRRWCTSLFLYITCSVLKRITHQIYFIFTIKNLFSNIY